MKSPLIGWLYYKWLAFPEFQLIGERMVIVAG